jgi:5-methylcytosine-specific restriction endonuclease McrA
MPTNKKGYMGDYYHKNKEKFNNPTEQAKRSKRNQARRIMTEALGVSAVRGKDIDHKRPLRQGGGNSRSNLRVMSKSKNRGR